ncbi:hypothetical protein BaRGS_00005284 [Batillaria attramentaria]|uniref:Uncharacterized protein n=1 Tax=Batillaria attramentaria TaxID=370345 RepID=A0ABD0LVE8_9CAEN
MLTGRRAGRWDASQTVVTHTACWRFKPSAPHLQLPLCCQVLVTAGTRRDLPHVLYSATRGTDVTSPCHVLGEVRKDRGDCVGQTVPSSLRRALWARGLRD